MDINMNVSKYSTEPVDMQRSIEFSFLRISPVSMSEQWS